MDVEILSEKDRARIIAIENQIDKYQKMINEAKEEILCIQVGNSPIQAGDVIQWEGRGTTGRRYRGRVHSVSRTWGRFTYRVKILTKDGREVGWAEVTTLQFPTLEEGANEILGEGAKDVLSDTKTGPGKKTGKGKGPNG